MSPLLVKALADMGFLGVQEPFESLFTQGMITRDGAKMSKSRGNTVDPAQFVRRYGADATRAYTLFMGPPEKGGDWNDQGIEGVHHFLSRLWRLGREVAERTKVADPPASADGDAGALLRKAHWAIERATGSFERGFKLNTAIAAVMELDNEIYSQGASMTTPKDGVRRFARTAASLIFLRAAPRLQVSEMLTGAGVSSPGAGDPAPRDGARYLRRAGTSSSAPASRPAAKPRRGDLRLARESEKVLRHLDGKQSSRRSSCPQARKPRVL